MRIHEHKLNGKLKVTTSHATLQFKEVKEFAYLRTMKTRNCG